MTAGRKSAFVAHVQGIGARRARYRRSATRQKMIGLGGPWRKVVYIFEREGDRGGVYWLLVLECGHFVARKRINVKSDAAMIRALFVPIAEKLAPKKCQCHSCESGVPNADPWVLVRAFGGPTP